MDLKQKNRWQCKSCKTNVLIVTLTLWIDAGNCPVSSMHFPSFSPLFLRKLVNSSKDGQFQYISYGTKIQFLEVGQLVDHFIIRFRAWKLWFFHEFFLGSTPRFFSFLILIFARKLFTVLHWQVEKISVYRLLGCGWALSFKSMGQSIVQSCSMLLPERRCYVG